MTTFAEDVAELVALATDWTVSTEIAATLRGRGWNGARGMSTLNRAFESGLLERRPSPMGVHTRRGFLAYEYRRVCK